MAQANPRQPMRMERRAWAWSPGVIASLVVALAIVAAGITYGVVVLKTARVSADAVPRLALQKEPPASVATSLSVSTVEVPDLTGMSSDAAETVLSAAGFVVRVRSLESTVAGEPQVVTDQDPSPGVLTETGVTVTIVLGANVESTSVTPTPKKKASEPIGSSFIVCIDPGHQGRSDSSPEPIGPGAKTMKARVTGGATGIATKVPEYETALQISMNLKKRLEERGVKVVMTRTTNDVNLSNSERAAIANKAKADLFVRVHGDGNPDSTLSGISSLYPEGNRWVGAITKRSKSAAKRVQSAMVAETSAVDRGTKGRSDLSGFNWSEVPAILIECGFLSNRIEDRLLNSPHYQDKVAEGVAVGIMGYLEAGEPR